MLAHISLRWHAVGMIARPDSSGPLGHSFNMGIPQYSSVRCDEWTTMHSRCCDDDLVRRVTMKCSWQLGRLNDDIRSELQEAYARISQSKPEPHPQRAREIEALQLHQFCDLPARKDADTHHVIFMLAQTGCLGPGELRRVVYPRQPDMRVQNNHCRTSQSSSATLSKGSI